MNKSLLAYRSAVKQKLGEENARLVIFQAEQRLKEIENENRDLTKSARFHTKSIFPRIALYQTLQKWMPKEQAFEMIRDRIWENCTGTGEKFSKITEHRILRMPFLTVFALITKKLFGSSAGFQQVFMTGTSRDLRFDITRCPYNDFFTRYGCPELTCVSCKADELSYGNLPGIVFSRTETLGCGGTRCDFHIYQEATNHDRNNRKN